jgi:hypothetical protein
MLVERGAWLERGENGSSSRRTFFQHALQDRCTATAKGRRHCGVVCRMGEAARRSRGGDGENLSVRVWVATGSHLRTGFGPCRKLRAG